MKQQIRFLLLFEHVRRRRERQIKTNYVGVCEALSNNETHTPINIIERAKLKSFYFGSWQLLWRKQSIWLNDDGNDSFFRSISKGKFSHREGPKTIKKEELRDSGKKKLKENSKLEKGNGWDTDKNGKCVVCETEKVNGTWKSFIRPGMMKQEEHKKKFVVFRTKKINESKKNFFQKQT